MKKIFTYIVVMTICLFSFPFVSTSVSETQAEKFLEVDSYNPDKAYNGTTLISDNHDPERPRIIEVNMKGEIVWSYNLPANLKSYTNPGFDSQILPNGNVLFLLPRNGIYEITRSGDVVWSHLDPKCSHDADRLPNGNTLYVYGANDNKEDAEVKEISPDGKIVWSWYAKNEFDKPPYKDIFKHGWTHTNAVTRMSNGDTLISPRNFNCLVEVDKNGKAVKIVGEKYLKDQHDPEILPNGNILVANHGRPNEILEIDYASGEIVWRYPVLNRDAYPVRDANLLPNGNILITGSTEILEVTRDKEIVWRIFMSGVKFDKPMDASGRGFYKAQRVVKTY